MKKRKILLDLNIHHKSILMDLETLSEYVKDYGFKHFNKNPHVNYPYL